MSFKKSGEKMKKSNTVDVDFLICPICKGRITKNFSNVFIHSGPENEETIMCFGHIQDALKNEGVRVTRYFKTSEDLIRSCCSSENKTGVLNAFASVKIPKDSIKKFF